MVKPAKDQYSQQVSNTDKNLMATDSHFGYWKAKPVTAAAQDEDSSGASFNPSVLE